MHIQQINGFLLEVKCNSCSTHLPWNDLLDVQASCLLALTLELLKYFEFSAHLCLTSSSNTLLLTMRPSATEWGRCTL